MQLHLLKNDKIFVSHQYHKHADKNFLRHCVFLGPIWRKYRHVLGKWYFYQLKSTIYNYNLTEYDTIFPKKIDKANLYQVDDVHLSFNKAFNNINNLLKPSTEIWNYNETKRIWKEQLRLPQQKFVEFALENY